MGIEEVSNLTSNEQCGQYLRGTAFYTEKCSHCFCPTQFCTCVMGWT